MRTHLSPTRAALLLVLAVMLAGCDAHPSDNAVVGPGGSGPLANYSPDPEIHPDDSYFLAVVDQQGSTTVQSDIPITHPVTGVVSNELTVQHEPETQRVEGGYSYDGRIIQVLDQTDSMADPLTTPVNSTRRTRSVDDYVTRYDQFGQSQPTDHEYVQSAGFGGPSSEQVTDGLVIDAASVDALAELTATAEPLAPASGPRAAVKRVRPDEIQITNQLSSEDFAMGGAAKDGREPERRGESVRTFRRRGQKYVLEEEAITTTHRTGTTNIRQRQVSRVRLVRYHENARKDRERRERRRGRPQPTEWTVQQDVDNCVVGSPEPCEPPPPPEDPPPGEGTAPCPKATSGVNVLFQHGILSSGQAWWRMEPWIRCSFLTNSHATPSISWTPSIPVQRAELEWYLAPGTETVLIGHSNGGLVVRSLAQWAQVNAPGRVRGVITIDSPNRGAVVAINAQVAESFLMGLAGGAGMVFDLVGWHPFWEDDVPGSPFLIRTNNFSESFTRVGIQTHTPKRWVAWRIFWTPSYCVPESWCGERAVAARIQEKYDRHRHYARFWYRPWQSAPAGASMLVMNGLDAVWNSLTAPALLTTDGFIHGPGQVYPDAQRNRLINNGDSHVGATRSEFVRRELDAALAAPDLFAIPVRY